MNLVDRVSAFFLIALAAVLITVSTMLYVLAHSYLYRQLSDRLDTALDILEGRMIVEIGMAVVRPAEFIILRFSHKLAES